MNIFIFFMIKRLIGKKRSIVAKNDIRSFLCGIFQRLIIYHDFSHIMIFGRVMSQKPPILVFFHKNAGLILNFWRIEKKIVNYIQRCLLAPIKPGPSITATKKWKSRSYSPLVLTGMNSYKGEGQFDHSEAFLS